MICNQSLKRYNILIFKLFGVSCRLLSLVEQGMLPNKCNIDNNDRVNRTVIGIILCLGVLLGMGAFFYFLVGVILIAEGAMGWCAIPSMIEKWKLKQKK